MQTVHRSIGVPVALAVAMAVALPYTKLLFEYSSLRIIDNILLCDHLKIRYTYIIRSTILLYGKGVLLNIGIAGIENGCQRSSVPPSEANLRFAFVFHIVSQFSFQWG